jgi:hypothetical protein
MGRLVRGEGREQNAQQVWMEDKEIKRLISGVVRCRLYKAAR